MLQINRTALFKLCMLENFMKPPINRFAAIVAMVFLLLGTAGIANAQRRNERQIRDLVRTLNAQIDDFQFGLDNQLKGTSASRAALDDVHDGIRNLQVKVDDLDENLNNRKDNRDDIYEIIAAAKDIDVFLTRNPQNRRIDTNWQGIRTTINTLASNYGVVADWNGRGPTSSAPFRTNNRS